MMTLLPMAAFAADRHASIAVIDKTSVTAGDGSQAKITVYARNYNNTSDSGATINVVSSRPTTDVITAGTMGTDGKQEFKIKSDVVGTARIAVGLGSVGDITSYLAGGSSAKSAEEAQIIEVFEINFTSSGVDKVRVTAATTNVTGTTAAPADPTAETTNITVTGNAPKGNGIEYYELTFTVTAQGGAPVANEEVTFSVSDTALKLNKTTATTDAAGTVKVRVTAEKSFGSFNEYVRAKAGSKNAYAHVNFGSPGVFDVVHVAGGNEKAARGEDYSFKFRLNDLNGNKISNNLPDGTAIDSASLTGGAYGVTISAPTRPSDVALSEDMSGNSGNGTVKKDKDNNFEVTIPGAKLNKDGDYVVRVSLNNGKYIDVPFTVQKQGELVRMELEYDTKAVALGAVSSEATLKYYDADNIVKKVTQPFSGITFSATPGAYVASVNQTTGEVTLSGNRNLTGEVLVTAVDATENLSATYTMQVAKEISGFNVIVPETTEVGKTAKVQLQLVDIDGVAIGAGSTATIGTKSVVVTSKPADAVTTAKVAAGFDNDLKEKGNPYIDVKSDTAGEVRVTAVVDINGVNYAKNFTVNFGAPKAEVPGANKVTLFIGQQVAVVDGDASVLDVAPFIKDGRTFVPVRFIAEALGADVKYDAATQTVTATRGDDVVVLTIGSNVMTVNGEAQVTDVAPFIVDGRTVLPFRALAEAFGSEVAWDAATQSVVFEK